MRFWLIAFLAPTIAAFALKETMKVLVVGATGATGRHVVEQLLQQKQDVSVIVRSKERMLQALETTPIDRLTITQASFMELSDQELKAHTQGVDCVVQTLGHTGNIEGIFGARRKLVVEAARRLTQSMSSDQKFVMMGTEVYHHPTDDIRPFWERAVLGLLRAALPLSQTTKTPQISYERASITSNGSYCVPRI